MDKSNALVPNIEKLVELVEENTPPTDPGNTPPTDPGNNPPSGAEVNKCKITLSFPSDHLVDGVAKYNTNHKMYFNIRVSDCSLDNVKFRDAKLGIDDYTISDIQQLGTGDYLGRSFKMHNGKLDLVYTLSAHPKALNYLKNKVSASNPILNTNAVLSVNQCTPNTDCKEKNVYWTNEQVPMSIDFSSVFPKSGGGSSGNNDINTNPDGSKSVLSSGDNDDSGDQILSFYPNKIIVRLTYLDQGDGTVCLGINDNEVETSMPFVKVTNNVDRALNIYSNLFYANSSELAYVQVSNKISKGQFYNVYPESYYRPVDNK
ncbi:MAG: hypothetical protein PHO23_03015 [Candidatus Pacebacteria bacterium]|nr:hypothetical protein [Candidatus Paceibacterota bacterium]